MSYRMLETFMWLCMVACREFRCDIANARRVASASTYLEVERQPRLTATSFDRTH